MVEYFSYSKEETTAEIEAYYNFLTVMYLPESTIKRPPPGGWPDITPEYLAPLRKNDTVVDLIRHLPYIQREEYHDPNTIYAWTAGVDFTGELAKHQLIQDGDTDLLQPMEEEGIIPSHVLTLATPSEGRDGYYIHIDTERGTAVLCDLQLGPKPTNLSQDKQNESDGWREFATYTIRDFFQLLRQHFMEFKIIPTSARLVEPNSLSSQEDDWRQKIQKIFIEEGVFTDRYNKEKCMARISTVEDV